MQEVPVLFLLLRPIVLAFPCIDTSMPLYYWLHTHQINANVSTCLWTHPTPGLFIVRTLGVEILGQQYYRDKYQKC